MVLRAVIFFAIFINLQFSSSLEDESVSDVAQPLSTDDHKVLEECHNEDYRTYLRCLKRHKRHHEIAGSRKSCLDECIMTNCTSSNCVHDCYTRCKKKITETYSKVTETEYECAGGDCNEKVPNITTNLNIKIALNSSCNNNTSATPKTAEGNETSKFTINNIITNLGDSSNCRCPGCNCLPWLPWPPMPQITIGFGPGPIGVGYQQNIGCGYCDIPFLRYKCNVTCYNSSGSSP